MKTIQLTVQHSYLKNALSAIVGLRSNNNPLVLQVGAGQGVGSVATHAEPTDPWFSTTTITAGAISASSYDLETNNGKLLQLMDSTNTKLSYLVLDPYDNRYVGIVFTITLLTRTRLVLETFSGQNVTDRCLFVPIYNNFAISTNASDRQYGDYDIEQPLNSNYAFVNITGNLGVPFNPEGTEFGVYFTKTMEVKVSSTEDSIGITVTGKSYNQASDPNLQWMNGLYTMNTKANAKFATLWPLGTFPCYQAWNITDSRTYDRLAYGVTLTTPDLKDTTSLNLAYHYHQTDEMIDHLTEYYYQEQHTQDVKIGDLRDEINSIELAISEGYYTAV